MRHVDVIIVGFGPTGMTLAALLGAQGRSVAVFERYTGMFNLPRAAAWDDETMRTFQNLGVAERMMPGINIQPGYRWVNASGETLLDIVYDNPGRNGWPAQYMMYQPHMEQVLDDLVASMPEVGVTRGATVDAIEEDADGVIATARLADGTTTQVRGRYLVGADGGNGFVRTHLEVGWDDYGFFENWLVCDFALRRDVPALPTFRQVCNPAEPIAIVNIGPGYHRFSFRLEARADRGEVAAPEYVWPRVAEYLGDEDADLIRTANYTFQSLIAREWRRGRIILAGDAAHQMPPFLAQGMVSGIRDSRNLAWKLGAVLDGSPDSVLDSYQVEREPHVRFITERAIELGRVQTERDPVKAAERDRRMLAARAANQKPDKLVYPGLSGGLIADDGRLLPQGLVSTRERTAMLDDLTGTGWRIIASGPDALSGLDLLQREAFTAIGGTTAVFGISSMRTASQYSDTGGVYTPYFAELGAVAVVVRPDNYVFGTAADPQDLNHLIENLLAALDGRIITEREKETAR